MKRGKCPKCGSEEVFVLDGKTHRALLEKGWGTITETSDYACAECGYIESYLRSESDKDAVRKGWQKVS